MTPSRLFVYLVYAVLIVGAVALGANVISAPAPAPDAPAEPVLISFTASGGSCVAEVVPGGATTVKDTDDGTDVVVRGNVSVPDANYAPDAPELVKVGPGNYTLDVTAHEVAEKAGRNCDAAQAGYELVVHVPPEAGHVTIAVEHGGERVSAISTGNGTGN